MSTYNPASKEIKGLATFNKVAKTAFPNYLINNKSEAFSTRKYHTDENRYSFVSDPEGRIDYLFNALNIDSSMVLQLNGPLVDLALKRITHVRHFGLNYTEFFVDTISEVEADKYGGVCTEINQGGEKLYRTTVGLVLPFKEFEREYNLAKLLDVPFRMLSDSIVDEILDREILVIEDNGFELICGKPMFPGINAKCDIGINFMEYPGNNELFLANLLVVKEQIFNRQRYIGVKMF